MHRQAGPHVGASQAKLYGQVTFQIAPAGIDQPPANMLTRRSVRSACGVSRSCLGRAMGEGQHGGDHLQLIRRRGARAAPGQVFDLLAILVTGGGIHLPVNSGGILLQSGLQGA